ncbi:hypothetical protein NQ315_004413 [Exocentrus adspersus]|uniref:Major facilitator superfamily (MFS) profile domain-containing protein n=1 Tax=Exocentrus adspersus TaxID=1586481 RepID=A0AAV8VAP3_9CUCU|nr:hypothetical protein NQ315_004413 [Exocentrus adspersus]
MYYLPFGFGKYNVYLILICGLVLFAANSESYGIGYIVPVAECELNLNTYTKGILTSTNIIGTMCSCAIWGYLSDFKGRKKLLMINLVLSSISGFLAAFTKSFWGFCTLRLINGICISCPAAVTSSTRAKAMAWGTSFVALAMISLPALGWLLLQSSIDLEFLSLHLNNWRAYMLVNSIPSILVTLALHRLPESPKYLYHCGKTEETLKILKKMYSCNTGKSEDSFSVLSLDEKVLEINENKRSVCQGLTQQLIPLFKQPLLTYTLVSCFMQAGAFSVSAGLYFWYPDIIKQISLSEQTSMTVCDALSVSHNSDDDINCNTIDDSVFIQNIIIGVTYLLAYATWGAVVKLLGTRMFFMSCMGVAALSTAAICILSSRVLINIFFIASFALSGITASVINAWVVEIFPTQICGIALCIVLTIGRLGSVLSSFLVGIMLEWNCITTFLLYALNLLGCVGLSLLLPQTS